MTTHCLLAAVVGVVASAALEVEVSDFITITDVLETLRGRIS